MTSTPGRFAPPSEAEVTRLVLEHPLAWVVGTNESGPHATPLPMRPVLDAEGRVTALLGHFARRNPQVETLRRKPRTLILFTGPHGYVSSSWFTDRTRTPTWNYAVVQYLVDVEFLDDRPATDAVLRDLIDAMEAGRPGAWSVQETGPRYEQLVTGIAAFRAHIVERRATFKLGQDERDAEYADIARALGESGESPLLDWMNRCNPGRQC